MEPTDCELTFTTEIVDDYLPVETISDKLDACGFTHERHYLKEKRVWVFDLGELTGFDCQRASKIASGLLTEAVRRANA